MAESGGASPRSGAQDPGLNHRPSSGLSLRSLGRLPKWTIGRRSEKQRAADAARYQSTRDLWFGLIEEEAKQDDFLRLGPKRRRFPHARQRQTRCPVLDPHAPWRLACDTVTWLAIIAAVVVVPFDLAFTNMDSAKPHHPTQLVVNAIDVVFLADIVLKFHTAIFDRKRDEWCLDRFKIARRYARSTFLLDLVAVVPWRYVATQASSSRAPEYFRPTTLRRLTYLSLFKLLRVARLLEMERNWRAVLGFLKHKDRIIMKYVSFVCLVLHYEACGIRFSHDVQTKRGDKDAETILTTRGHWGTPLLGRDDAKSTWVEYVICLDWALSTMLAESSYLTAFEAGLSVLNMLFGLFFLSYLIADLTNTLCNTDPARNDYKMTSDTLRDFLEESRVPGPAIESVRERVPRRLPLRPPRSRATAARSKGTSRRPRACSGSSSTTSSCRS